MPKPFLPPLLNRRPSGQLSYNIHASQSCPPVKRRRISQDQGDDEVLQERTAPLYGISRTPSRPRNPLLAVVNPAAAEAAKAPANAGVEGYYIVLWRKFTTKKNKTWDGDGVLSLTGGFAHLQDISGKELGKTAWNAPLLPGSALSIGGKDVEVDCMISKADFLAGKPFLGGMKPPPPVATAATPKGFKAQIKQEKLASQQAKTFNITAAKTKATTSTFKTPLLSTTVMPKCPGNKPRPRHDPNVEGALVMKRLESVPKGKQIVDVVVDPHLSKRMREHQKEGVMFLYECVMGMRHEGEGAILADSMGLGKTLQTIALLWTLLKQNPIYGDPPVIKKALIVCPVGLINNWRQEFWRWLGKERVGVFTFMEEKKRKIRITDFTMGKVYSIMIVGYEKLRTVQEELRRGSGVDIVILDEGHKLKTAQNKAALAVKAFGTEKRIYLSGTPIQNDLSEFFYAADLVNPGLLGKWTTFKREFEGPILKMRQPEATAKDIEKGKGREEELQEISKRFMLRRGQEIMSKYLPPKTEYVLFCRPTNVQASVYRSVLQSPAFNAVLGSSEASLQLINVLKKVCNSPSLLRSRGDKDSETTSNETIASLLTSIPYSLLKTAGASGKLQVLDSLLHRLHTTTSEKVVLVSNYTSTLDILGNLLSALSYPFLRLDGSTPAPKRQPLVDKFNNATQDDCFAFLLSAKAGGVGLNLIGASRLVLFDVDWNPSTDLQAMARIHRDGQLLHCRIYRLLTMGALDEKIYQRQLTKTGLADSVVDGKESVSSFSREELRDLFRLDEGERCRTHEVLRCECGGKGNVQALEAKAEEGEVVGLEIEEDEEEVFPDLPALVKASQVDIAEQERRIKETAEAKALAARGSKQRGKYEALMEYLHIDTALLSKKERDDEAATPGGEEGDDEVTAVDEIEALVDDEVLLNVLKEEGCRVKFMFSKLNTS
ncbi:hypothetical protein M501DRAFT_1028431 [Patellaria atrata CBS 101060]|uniref:DsDNA-dependent ATPase n=1 Tax=Patellaria atrata CBS 101060 TaxID=1346257 RepID=A0A9P4SJ64_9PEZI|nr:hypothetical protein M501DRAFT_1028431 [Patellaria atrata CBS 101060]